jgi:hypothetical protein
MFVFVILFRIVSQISRTAINEESAREIQVKKLLQFLPQVNFCVIRALCAFFLYVDVTTLIIYIISNNFLSHFLCSRLQKHSDLNMMTPKNISICFAQNVLRPPPVVGRNAKEEMNMVRISISHVLTNLKKF